MKTSLCFQYVRTSARVPKVEAAPTHRYSDLAQNVLWYGHVFLDNLFVKLVQRSVHQLHTDPHITLATHTGNTLINGEITRTHTLTSVFLGHSGFG